MITLLIIILLLVGVFISKNYNLPQHNGGQLTQTNWTLLIDAGRKKGEKRYLLRSVMPVFVGVIIDAFVFYGDILQTKSNTQFTQLGIMIFFGIVTVKLIRDAMETYREGVRSDFYKTLAYRDGLTKIRNRAAFQEEIKKIDENLDKYADVVCISADVNGLKEINDTQGHLAGDEVICRLSSYLTKFFGPIGKIYRVGGDEFITLVYGKTMAEIASILESMKKETLTENETKNVKLQYSVGVDQRREEDQTIEDSVQLSDHLMYKDKAEHKKMQP